MWKNNHFPSLFRFKTLQKHFESVGKFQLEIEHPFVLVQIKGPSSPMGDKNEIGKIYWLIHLWSEKKITGIISSTFITRHSLVKGICYTKAKVQSSTI